MTDFVMQEFDYRNGEHYEYDSNDNDTLLKKVINYANFLKQHLTLSMFVPCDEEGNVLLGKPLSPAEDSEWIRWENEQESFFEAREKVLFEGFVKGSVWYGTQSFQIISEDKALHICTYKGTPDYFIWSYKTVEDLVSKNITLSETALKQIYG